MINIRAKLKQIKTMKSGIKVIFWTQDVPDELDELQYTGEEGNVVFCTDELKEAVIKAVQDKRPGAYEDKSHSESQQLRGLIFQVFVKKYPQHIGQSTKESRDAWAEAYKSAMEIHKNYWREKL